MASSGRGDGSARRGRDEDDTASQAGSKKPRPSNRRVSFGGAHVKLFSSDNFMGGDHFASPALEVNVPQTIPEQGTRRLTFDDAGESTLPLANPGDPGMPTDSLDLIEESMRFSTDTNTMRMSGNFDFHNLESLDEDGSARQPRFSVMHGLYETAADDDMTIPLTSDRPPAYPVALAPSANANSEPRAARPPLPNRPSLPAKRQLFSDDDGEDATLHFQPSASTGILRSASRAMPVDTTVSPAVTRDSRPSLYAETPPPSALGSKIRAAALERSGKKPDAPTIEYSVNDDDTVVAGMASESAEGNFPLVEKHFARFWPKPIALQNVTDLSAVSPKPNAEADSKDVHKYDLDTLGGQLGACITKMTLMDILDKEIAAVRNEIDKQKEHIAEVSAIVERERSDKLRQLIDATPQEFAPMRPDLSKIHRFYEMKAKADWYERRTRMENEVTVKVRTLLEQQVDKRTAECLKLAKEGEEQVKVLHEQVTEEFPEQDIVPASEETIRNLRDDLKQRNTIMRKLKEEKSKEEVLREQMDEAEKRAAALDLEIEELRRCIANPVEAIAEEEAKVIARKKRRAELTGINTRWADDKNLIVRIANVGDLHAKKEGSVVSIVDVKPRALPELPKQMRDFIYDSVRKVKSKIANVTKFKDLPKVLHLMVTNLILVCQTCAHSGHYIDRYGLDLLDTTEEQLKEEYSQLRLYARYFNREKQMFFGVEFAVRFYPPVYDGATGLQKLGEKEICVERAVGTIGDAPPLEALRREVENAQGGLIDKMESLWRFVGGVPKVENGGLKYVPVGSV